MSDLTPDAAARQAIDTMIRKFPDAGQLPPAGHFHYHQGVFLSGVVNNAKLLDEPRYFDYAKAWVDAVTAPDGTILNITKNDMDDIQPGILLFDLINRYGETRYKVTLDDLISRFDDYPTTEEGGLWHKGIFPNQMWLDGLYMGGPIRAQYGAVYNRPELFDEVAKHVLLMREHTRDERTGLWRHAWDWSRTQPWADPETGKSPEFWGRSIGWVPVAVLDDLDWIPADHPKRGELERTVIDLLDAVCQYQGPDGRWWQVVDKVNDEPNWPENSCTCLFVAALCKAARIGLVDASCLDIAARGYHGVINSLTFDGDNLLLGDVCIGTGVGDYPFYCARPTSVNDLHGMGAFLLMCAEAQRAGIGR